MKRQRPENLDWNELGSLTKDIELMPELKRLDYDPLDYDASKRDTTGEKGSFRKNVSDMISRKLASYNRTQRSPIRNLRSRRPTYNTSRRLIKYGFGSHAQKSNNALIRLIMSLYCNYLSSGKSAKCSPYVKRKSKEHSPLPRHMSTGIERNLIRELEGRNRLRNISVPIPIPIPHRKPHSKSRLDRYRYQLDPYSI